MFCDKCGAENPDDSTFCQKCGESLTDTPAPKSKGSAKSKAKARPKRSTAGSRAESTSSINTGGLSDMLKGLPWAMILVIAGAVALFIAFLSGILAAAGAGDFVEGSAKAAIFFDHMVDGIMVAGILIGLSALISKGD